MKSSTCYLFMFVLIVHFANGQLIKKEEAAQINKLLQKLSDENKPGTYLIRNATVITMRDSVIMPEYDVLIENGVIAKIGKDLATASAVTEIDASEKFIMPGLVDMHAHLFLDHPLMNTWILHLLMSGVTTLRDMSGNQEKLLFREKISRNEILAPTIYQSSPLVDSRKDKFVSQVISSEDARDFVQKSKRVGYDFIKVYDGLKGDIYDAIIDESRKQDMLVVGHIPYDVDIDRALQSGQNSIEHLTGYFKWNGPIVELNVEGDYATLTATSGTWNCPTIYNHFLNGSREGVAEVLADPISKLIPKNLYELWSKRQADNSKNVVEIVDKYGASNFEALKSILVNMYHAKAKLLLGTDAGNLPFLIPGYSLHKEMEMISSLTRASNYDLLKMATHDAAFAMRKDGEFGTIEEGKRADLILLSENPIEHLRTLHVPSGVMIRGIWISDSLRSKIASDMKLIFGR